MGAYLKGDLNRLNPSRLGHLNFSSYIFYSANILTAANPERPS